MSQDPKVWCQVEEFRAKHEALTRQDKQHFFFQLLKSMRGSSYELLGLSLCEKAFLRLARVSRSFVRRLNASSDSVQPPEDGRSLRTVRAQPCAADVDSFFNFCYHYLAEHLAEGLAPHETGEASDIEDDTLECTEHEILRDNPAAVAAQENLPQRWLPPMKLSELYDNYEFLYQAETVSSHPAASRSVFYKIFKSRWRGVLRFRKHSQHSKCDHCVRYQMGRQKATTETERKQVQEAYRAHLGQVFRDRDLAAHYARHSELSNAPGSTIPASQRTLYIQLDGMDQAKFSCPRGVDNSKTWESRWKPELHNVAVICHGVVECYFLMDQDQRKDSNCQCTVLCKALEHCEQELQSKGLTLPGHVLIHQDNTCREGRNQWVSLFCMHLIATNRFRSASTPYFQVGHTHALPDQRFSTLAHLLHKAGPLESPEHFCAIIRERMLPMGGRRILAEVLPFTWDFQVWLQNMNVSLSGLAITESEPWVNHSFRFVQRRDLASYSGLELWPLLEPLKASCA